MTETIHFPIEGTAMDAAFLELTLRERLLHERAGSWATDATEIPPLGEVVASHRSGARRIEVIRRDDGALRVQLDRGGWLHLLLACPTREALAELAAIVRHQMPVRPPADDDERRVTVTFWSNAQPEPLRASRQLEVAGWGAVRGNYAAATAEPLGELMAAELPPGRGRLVLWHGAPGTGKTNALRALGWEWRERADLNYVTDPEALLRDPAYLQHVLLDGESHTDRWRLIVLEDATELLEPEVAGQGLARLLNLTDGLVGQGLRVLILITGNEPLERLHPAVARPGRCAARIEFRGFGAAEAAAWLAERAGAPARAQPGTLADLYARLEGGRLEPPRRRVGFAA